MKKLAEVLTRLRLDIAVTRARSLATTTEELWLELAGRFPLQALVIGPITKACALAVARCRRASDGRGDWGIFKWITDMTLMKSLHRNFIVQCHCSRF